MSLFDELKRRNVFRVAVAYVAVSWLIIQVVETLFPIFGLSNTAIRTIVIVLAVGFIPAIVSAWAFELTPEGLVRDSDVDRTSPVVRRMGKRLDRLIIVVLTIALAYFVYDKFFPAPVANAAVAVLAFDDHSPNNDQEWFADGMSAEIRNLLTKIPKLSVTGKTSSEYFRDKEATIADIGEMLNVTHIIEGSVSRIGDRIRISVQLSDAVTEDQVWSESYDRNLGDIFAIQDDVTTAVVGALHVRLLGSMPQVEEIDPEAYVLTMQARHLLDQSGEGHPAEAEALLHRAWEIDPGRPRIGYELRRIYLGHDDRKVAEITADMVAFDADNSFTLGALAYDAYRREDLAEAARLYQRALAADPTNVGVTKWGWGLALQLGRPDIAVALGEYTAANDPLCGTCYRMLGNVYRHTGQWDESEAALRTSIRLGHPAEYSLVTTLLLKGDSQAALDALDAMAVRDPEPGPQTSAARAIALYELGRQGESDASFDELKTMRTAEEDLNWRPSIAAVYAWIGENDKAFEWLSKARAADPDGLYSPFYESYYFHNVHDDPRWPIELEKWGITAAPRGSIEFDITLP